MSGLDWAVLVAYVLAIVGFGLWVGRRNRGATDYYLAGRSMPWWAIGLSVMATQISAITFIGTTGQAYSDGMRFLVVYFGLPVAMVILCVTFVPMFTRAGVVTAYEYLEQRFDLRTRTLTSVLFLFSRGLSVGVTLYAPAVVLSVILGLSEHVTIVAMTVATLVYVVRGGNRSVIWTDVAQMAIIWIGIFTCIGVAFGRLPHGLSLHGALAVAQTAGRLNADSLSLSLTQPYTVWSGLIAGTFLALSYFGCDQSQVQRYLAGANLTQSRLSLLFNAMLKVPMQFLILLTGVLVFVFYHFQPAPLIWNAAVARQVEGQVPATTLQRATNDYEAADAARREAALALGRAAGDREAARARYIQAERAYQQARDEGIAMAERAGLTVSSDSNYVFPTFVMTQLPHGLAGLVIAVIFAAAMSTLSGELNSLSTATMVDFVSRFGWIRGGDEGRALRVSRWVTVAWGVAACGVALSTGRLGSIIEVVNRFGSYFYGSILGVFLLAVLIPRATGRGATAGLAAGMTSVAVVALGTSVHYLWYNVVSTAAVLLVGGIVTLLPARRNQSA